MTTSAYPPLGVQDLDPAGVLAAVAEADRAERRAGVAKLELALQWCVAPAASACAAAWGHAGLPGLDQMDETLAVEGTLLVSAAPAFTYDRSCR